RAIRFDWQERHVITALLEMLTELGGGRVLDGSRNDVAFGRVRHERAVNRRVDAFGAATGKNDFARIGVEERGGFGAGWFNLFGYLVAEGIGTRRIAPAFGQKREHRFDDFGCDPGRG